MSDKIISFSYVGFITKNPAKEKVLSEIFRPVVPIRISHGRYISRVIESLVDSGSDWNLLPAYYAEAIGLNFSKTKPVFITGIGGIKVKSFPSKIRLFIEAYSFETEVLFSYEHQIPLLGRKGFFNLFKKVILRENDQFLDLVLK